MGRTDKIQSILQSSVEALQLDETAATGRMVENLIDCYGTKDMGAAGAIITQYRLEDGEDGLRALISNEKWRVRNGALNTLDGLKKARRAPWAGGWQRARPLPTLGACAPPPSRLP